MRRIWILIFFVGLPIILLGQQKTEYNQKGDEAMKRLDYSDASPFGWQTKKCVRPCTA